MNLKIFAIFVIVILGIGTGSLLELDSIAIWLQGLKVFNSLNEITNPQCNCENPENPSEIGPQYCPRDANGFILGDPNHFCPAYP